MPCEFVTNFDARYPIILGGLLSSEDKMGFLQVSALENTFFANCFHQFPFVFPKNLFLRYNILPGPFQKAPLAQAHTQDSRSADHVYWLAQISDASYVLDPGPQWPSSSAEVHSRTFALYGYLVWYVENILPPSILTLVVITLESRSDRSLDLFLDSHELNSLTKLVNSVEPPITLFNDHFILSWRTVRTFTLI